MLPSNVIKLLNEQMNLEFYSSNLYLQMSAWCEHKGYVGAAQFLNAHAAEEMQHMRKIFTYLIETGAEAKIESIEAPAYEYQSLRQVIELTFEHEKLITSKINALVTATLEAKDWSAFNHLQWFVGEQHEEEKLFGSILDKFNIVGEDGKSLFFIDKDLARLASSNAN
ncbi:MAG: non-heme ferritin [[Actinobacillus] rossii]|uniref:Ferritin n=1 Tax=[Actinobacillus] rossii TaxID=123820 RepID=A0A380TWZ6_9PAST|nr:non-heme ferritin [[Actinobacillus] rossii]MDD7426256.1 non-heme ferritin [[Actinobacillus] rossii]MDY3123318.1 non-heme ferritin [[Actinobacillus] rossii]MDY4505865.1 non-heme ferritin [[Actinobacillus] rossii]SUT92542.1 ferroxidase [[Actinobacillus] rossii]